MLSLRSPLVARAVLLPVSEGFSDGVRRPDALPLLFPGTGSFVPLDGAYRALAAVSAASLARVDGFQSREERTMAVPGSPVPAAVDGDDARLPALDAAVFACGASIVGLQMTPLLVAVAVPVDVLVLAMLRKLPEGDGGQGTAALVQGKQ